KDAVVTIGDNGNWFINGEDTGKTAKGEGEPGKAPRINEAGNWEIYNAETQAWEDTQISATGASTYVVDMGSYYQLNVMDAETNEYTVVNLPKTGAIADMKAVSINENNQMVDGAHVYLNYGKKLANKRVFNGNTYAAGTNLVAGGSSLKAMVNPISVNAGLFNFKLVDSKGNAPYVIGTATPYVSNGPIMATKAKTPNTGVWNMPVELSADLNFSGNYELDNYAAERSKAAYALTTETWEGTIATAYDVAVTEQKIEFNQPYEKQGGKFVLATVNGKAGESIDLMEAFEKVQWMFKTQEGLNDDGTPKYSYTNSTAEEVEVTVNGSVATPTEYTDLTPYIKDCYFALYDKTAAAQLGVTGIDGTSVVATKQGSFIVRAYFLLVDGYCADGNYYNSSVTFTVNVNHVAAETTLAPVEWTINGTVDSDNVYTKNVAYLNIESIKSLLNPTSDSDKIYVKVGSDWTWDGETALDKKTVVVNEVYYGAAATNSAYKFKDHEANWITTIEEGVVRRNNNAKDKATNYARSQVVRFTFDPANA
ncbi:MAG: hypothetical protein IKU18_03630, partial [Bacteroidales bacterium]|nr:hypothetical protein [Bacteroidales bacterium]